MYEGGHGQHRVSEINFCFTPKRLHISVLQLEFKQNNDQITLTPLNFDLGKVRICLNLMFLLNKIRKNVDFGHCPDLPVCLNMKNNENASKLHQKNDFSKSPEIAQL